MTQFDRYILRRYLTAIGLVFLIFVAMMLVYLLLDELNTFIRYENVSWLQIVRYIIFSLPHLLVRFLPLVVLMALIFTLHQMMKWGEVTAIMASGASHRRISLVFLGVGLALVFVQFFINELVAAQSEAVANRIMNLEIKQRNPGMAGPSGIFVRGSNNRFYHALLFDRLQNRLQNVKIYQLHPRDDSLMTLLRAEDAVYEDGNWVFYNGEQLDMRASSVIRRRPFIQRTVPLDETPEAFLDLSLDARQMSYTGLKRFIQVLESTKEDASRYMAELHLKVAFPFSCLIFTLIALTVAFRLRGTNLTFEIGLAVALGFVYYMITYFIMGLGNHGLLDPWLAAWLPTLLFGAVSLTSFFFTRTDYA